MMAKFFGNSNAYTEKNKIEKQISELYDKLNEKFMNTILNNIDSKTKQNQSNKRIRELRRQLGF